MIVNIMDHRTNNANVNCDVVFEPSCHDNSCDGATQFEWSDEFTVGELYNTTIMDAISFANNKWKCETTMFVYDVNSKPVG